jgi:mRNA interferase RelE/StbE
MAAYKIFFRKSVQKDFEAIPKKDLQRILKRIEGFANDPRPPGSEKLTGQERYRLRQEIYRILYSIQDDELTIWVVNVAHRKEVYRQ